MAKTKDNQLTKQKLTTWQVWAIRLSKGVLSNKELAQRFGVDSPNTIQKVREWVTYKDVLTVADLSDSDQGYLWQFVQDLSTIMLNKLAIAADAKRKLCVVRQAFVSSNPIPLVFGESDQVKALPKPERKQVDSQEVQPEPINPTTNAQPSWPTPPAIPQVRE